MRSARRTRRRPRPRWWRRSMFLVGVDLGRLAAARRGARAGSPRHGAVAAPAVMLSIPLGHLVAGALRGNSAALYTTNEAQRRAESERAISRCAKARARTASSVTP